MFCSRKERKSSCGVQGFMRINLLGVLFVALVILKVTNLTPLSWLWVFAPIWMPAGLGVVVIGGVLLLCAILEAVNGLTRTLRKK